MKSLAEIVADALAKAASEQEAAQAIADRSGALKNYKTKFVAPPPNASQPVRAPGYHYVFCSHNIPYFSVCAKCGRDKALAKRNADMVLKSIGGSAFFTK